MDKKNINKKHKCIGLWAKTKYFLALQVYERQISIRKQRESSCKSQLYSNPTIIIIIIIIIIDK